MMKEYLYEYAITHCLYLYVNSSNDKNLISDVNIHIERKQFLGTAASVLDNNLIISGRMKVYI